MIQIVKVEQFKTSDGKIHPTMVEAKNHEVKQELRKFMDDHWYNGMSKDDVADILFDHGIELYNILKGLP